MCFIGVPEGQDRYKEAESLFKEKKWLKISLTQRKKKPSKHRKLRVPNKITLRRPTRRHGIMLFDIL